MLALCLLSTVDLNADQAYRHNNPYQPARQAHDFQSCRVCLVVRFRSQTSREYRDEDNEWLLWKSVQ
jgi:hypothetical protein